MLNRYLEFSVASASKLSTICIGTHTPVTDLIVYENSVPASEQIPGLCEFLEDRYEQIRIFAQRILANICLSFPTIPVYLSKECPEKTYYYEREFLLKNEFMKFYEEETN